MNKLPILIDFDGVIKLGKDPAPDAGDFLNFIIENNIPAYIISNSTLRTGAEITSYLIENKLPAGVPSMTAADATLQYVKANYKKVSVYCIDKIKQRFSDYIDDKNPEAVVVGDNGKNWDYNLLNEMFKKVFDGADIIAMQMNRYWYPDVGNLSLDAGSFIKAIEYASGKEAVLIGKPSPIYFKSALNLLGYPSGAEFLMIGDDIESDIIGAQKIGGKGILIYTGKTKYPLNDDYKIKPDFEAKNLTETIKLLTTHF
jgi:HAD superfamily hydrolase (TIGR01458 family)